MIIKNISDAKDIIDSGEYILVDVRHDYEYEDGHIKGAINHPLEFIDYIEDSIEKNAKILLYCRSGRRSESALQIMKDMGYKNVYNIGGILDWKYDTIKGSN